MLIKAEPHLQEKTPDSPGHIYYGSLFWKIIKISSLFPSLIVPLFNKSAQVHVLWMLKGDWLHWSRGEEMKTVCFFPHDNINDGWCTIPLKHFNPINVLKYLIYWGGGNWSYSLWPILNLYMSCLFSCRLWPLMPQVFIKDPVSRSSRLFPLEYSLTKWLFFKSYYTLYIFCWRVVFRAAKVSIHLPRIEPQQVNSTHRFGPLKMANSFD